MDKGAFGVFGCEAGGGDVSNLDWRDPAGRFGDMVEHCGGCDGKRVVMADVTRLLVVVDCGCGDSWFWRLSELRARKPSTELVEKFFKDVKSRWYLEMCLNGVMVVD